MGGIKKVLSLLTREWCKECKIHIVSFAPIGTHYEIFGKSTQHIFPNFNNILSDENIYFLSQIIQHEKIDIIFHPFTMNNELTKLCVRVKQKENIKLISAIHFSITYKTDLIKNSFFNKYRLGYNPIKWAVDLLLYCKYYIITRQKVYNEYRSTYRYLIKNSDKVVVLSYDSAQTIKRIAQIDKKEENKISYINNPVLIQNEEIPNKKNKIIWCGRLDFAAKRVDRIIDIWKTVTTKNPKWELIVIGDGNLEYFKKIAKKQHIDNIKFVGSCDPFDYYKDGAIFCLTSTSEGWPMVLMEALSMECIPIAYNSFATAAEIIRNNNGVLVTPFNKQEYIDKLQTLISDGKFRELLKSNCRESIKAYSHEIIVNKWMKLFIEVTR